MNRRLMVAVLVSLVFVVAGVSWFAAGSDDDGNGSARILIDPDTMRLVSDTVRIKVELLNASGERGIARRAMHYFRERGFDVVSVGNAKERQDSSVVLDRSGHAAWATLAARALGGARVEISPDSSRYLDLTILLGARFRPPPQILYP
jgi:hypothetical protein